MRIVVIVLLCGLLSGCNIFEGVGHEPSDPQGLLEDARAALDRGNSEQAVRLLEEAFALEPENPEIRIELVWARFAVADVDLLTLKGLVDHINEPSDASNAVLLAPSSQVGKAGGMYCTFSADPEGLEVFDYTATPEYQQIQAAIESFQEARTLLDGVRPAALKALSEDLRAKWYLLRSFTRIVLAIEAINREVKRIEATLYRLPSMQNSIGICATSEFALDQAEARIKCDYLPRVVQGIAELEIRSQLLDEAEIGGVLDDVREAVDIVGRQLDSSVIRFCSGTTGD